MTRSGSRTPPEGVTRSVRRYAALSEFGVALERGPLRSMIGLAVFSAATVLLHLLMRTWAIVSPFEAFMLIAATAWVLLRSLCSTGSAST